MNKHDNPMLRVAGMAFAGNGLPLAIFALVLLCSCSTISVNSYRPAAPIVIDGDIADWGESLRFDDDEKILFGVANDDDYLYVCVVSGDRETQAQVLMRGFTVWLDPEGGSAREYGIRYPLEVSDPAALRGMLPARERGQLISVEDLYRRTQERLGQVGIVRDESVQKIPLGEVPEIKVKISLQQHRLVYELQVPLKQSQYVYINLREADEGQIGLGMTTPEMKREGMGRRPSGRGGGGGGMPGGAGGGMPGGGGGGMPGGGGGGMSPGGMGGGRGGFGMQRPQMPETLNIWLGVQLTGIGGAD